MTKQKTFYITTPIYYVNDAPHIGHAYTTLACDTMARFKRLDGYEVKFLTGTDEHGQKVEKAASDAGMSPQDFVDKVSKTFRHLADEMQITNDDFIRTTEERHKKAAQNLWQELAKRNQIYLGSYAGWYSVRDEAFYAEGDLIDGNAPTGAPVEWVEEPSYFFKLSEYQDKLLKFYEENPDFITPESRRNEVISFVKGGLRDLSISRTSFSWGVPVPGDPKHIMYVWLDALTNYITALGYPDTDSSDFQKFWPEAVHVVGKDILRFHAVYWPAFLMAADLPLPKKIVAHGWWTIEGVKMSKSLGNVVCPIKMVDKYGLTAVRHYVLKTGPHTDDRIFKESLIAENYNSDVVNTYANLVYRTLSLIYKNCNKGVPILGILTEKDLKICDDFPVSRLHAFMDDFSLGSYAITLFDYCRSLNSYIDQEKPWELKKTDRERMNTVLYVLFDMIRITTIFLYCHIPEVGKILHQMKIPEQEWFLKFCTFSDGRYSGKEIEEPTIIFRRIE